VPHLHILVAEDNATSQIIARKILEKAGHEVQIAGNGVKAVRMVKEGNFDLILMDVEKPEMNGLEATQLIRKAEQATQLTSGQGTVTIIEVSETTVKIDANHPLAGQDLTFDIELVEIGGSQPQVASLTAITLKEALSNGKPTLAEFGRGTCIPCKQMKPILENLALEYKNRLNVSIVSVDEYRDLTNYYKVMAIPTQIGFDSSGKEIFRHVGFWAKEDIIAKLTEMGIK
jgi:thioredoxin 1